MVWFPLLVLQFISSHPHLVALRRRRKLPPSFLHRHFHIPTPQRQLRSTSNIHRFQDFREFFITPLSPRAAEVHRIINPPTYYNESPTHQLDNADDPSPPIRTPPSYLDQWPSGRGGGLTNEVHHASVSCLLYTRSAARVRPDAAFRMFGINDVQIISEPPAQKFMVGEH